MLSWLDLRLGVRMLVRYPVLTVIGTASPAFGIAMGAAVLGFVALPLWPTLPLPDGHEIVSVRLYDVGTSSDEPRLTADYLRWRDSSSSLTDFSAGRGLVHNLSMGDGVIEPVDVAEVTASMFATTRVAPVAGRALTEADAGPSAGPWPAHSAGARSDCHAPLLPGCDVRRLPPGRSRAGTARHGRQPGRGAES